MNTDQSPWFNRDLITDRTVDYGIFTDTSSVTCVVVVTAGVGRSPKIELDLPALLQMLR